jgi:hypothetical protein
MTQHPENVDLDEVPTWHDQKEKHKALENFICVLEHGHSFGELAMLRPEDGKRS